MGSSPANIPAPSDAEAPQRPEAEMIDLTDQGIDPAQIDASLSNTHQLRDNAIRAFQAQHEGTLLPPVGEGESFIDYVTRVSPLLHKDGEK